MDKAIWVEDYDYKTDKCYTAVGCPYCEERLLKNDEGYYCPCCGNIIEVDDKDMIKWLKDREERLKMLMETGEFDFMKDIPPDKIWKLVFMLKFIEG